jgi:serine/threonine protein kinase
MHDVTVMDYISGGELHSLVDGYGCLPEEVVRIYVAEIALAIGKLCFNISPLRFDIYRFIYKYILTYRIDFLHNAGIVHRDLKTTNILLDENGHAVITDFGLAKWLQRTERTNTLCGTPRYMGKRL